MTNSQIIGSLIFLSLSVSQAQVNSCPEKYKKTVELCQKHLRQYESSRNKAVEEYKTSIKDLDFLKDEPNYDDEIKKIGSAKDRTLVDLKKDLEDSFRVVSYRIRGL